MSELNSCFVVLCVLFLFAGCISACPSGCKCGSNAPYLTSCIDRNFTEIPSNIPLNTEELYLKGNRIKTLSEGAFRDLVNLKRLVFTHNKLESLEANAFVGLTELIHLNLQSNNLASLPSYAFSGLPSLRLLELDSNAIVTIAESAFIDLNLTKLGLENNNKLTEIHPDAFQDSSVLNLYLFGSNLNSQSAEAFRNLRSSLQEFSWLDNKQPITFRIDIFQGFRFTKLNLENIGLRDVSFLKHVKADYINLVGNPIGPIDFSRFPSLFSVQTLHLEDTNFVQLEPKYFNDLTQLQSLHLQNNGITTVAESMKTIFSRLKSLKFDGNAFHCNCELIWLKRLLTNPEFQTVVTGTVCSTPFSEDIANVEEDRFQCTAPTMVNITKEVTVRQDATLTISCFAEGDPSPQIHWELPDRRIKSYSPMFNRTETIVRRDFSKVAKFSDAGTYRCIAINLLGNDSTTAVVKVLPSLVSSSLSLFTPFFSFQLALVLLLTFVVCSDIC